jgi:acylphosphatase
MPAVCKRVRYSGRVQGVGFRMTAAALAGRYPGLNGYVRNLPDGDVELVAEGEQSLVEGFLGAVARKMGGYVANTAVADEPPGRESGGFRIRHD